MALTFGSLFAGIGGFDLGFHQAGLSCSWQVEIDAAARSVLARHWPDVPRHADVRAVGKAELAPVDIICGGFPCQDLSVAGNRAGLAGARSGLFYEMTRITDELRPLLLVWENVPGLLSSDDGRDFARVLLELDRIGYSGCWTTLDAQFFGVAQRRQRVFGVFAHRDIGAARCAEILSLTARLPWNTEPRRAARQGVASALTRSAGHHGRSSPQEDGSDNLIAASAIALSNRGRSDQIAETVRAGSHGALPMVAATLNSGGNHGGFRTEPGEHLVVSIAENQRGELRTAGVSAQLTSGGKPGQGYPAVFEARYARNGRGAPDSIVPPLKAESGQTGKGDGAPLAVGGFGIRRLTPRECERLQGFPDDWTAEQPDSARYRQLGNAVAVPCAQWIGRRIVEVL